MIDDLKRARAVGTPLVAIVTADQPATVERLQAALPESAAVVAWDIVRGFRPLNQAAGGALSAVLGGADPLQYTNPVEALTKAAELPPRAMLVACNMHRVLEDNLAAIQAVINLRDVYKADGRTLAMLCPGIWLPPELAQDVLVIDEPLPADDEIRAVITRFYRDNEIPADDALMDRAVDALRGLAAFPVEQAAALSVRKTDGRPTVDISDMWARKRRMIEQVRGLSMETPAEDFSVIGGLDNIKSFANRLFSGPRRPRVVVFIDEIEKALAGAGASGGFGDSSGVSQDALGVMLSEMEDRKYSGIIAVGPPGSGKSLMARAVASTYQIPLLKLDLGAMKGSLVGESEFRVRAALKAVLAIAGEAGALFVATCNRLDSLPPELRRRFRYGLWFFDLPDAAERQTIGTIQAAKYGIADDATYWAALEGWSGANIRDLCELAYAMQCPAADAASWIVPAAVQDAAGLERLRQMAAGRFLSASYPGTYRMPAVQVAAVGRKLHEEELN